MRASALMANAKEVTMRKLNNEFGIFGPGKECFPWVLFDKQTYPAAGFTAPVTFFQRQQSVGGIAADITNMPGAGQFPANVQFVADSLEYVFIPSQAAGRFEADASAAASAPVNIADMENVCSAGYVEIIVGNVKNYGKISPLAQLVPSYRVAGLGAVALSNSNFAAAADVPPTAMVIDQPFVVGESYPIGPFFIPSMTSFVVQLSFPSGAVAVAADSTHYFNLNGLYIQQRQ